MFLVRSDESTYLFDESMYTSKSMISLSLLPQAERLRRMLGKDEDENKKKPKHMSADDLNDGFILDKDDRRLLSYKVSCAPPLLM